MEPKKWTNYLYYILVGVLSFITLLFLPMLGSEVGLGFQFPNTAAGWIVYIISQLIVAIINVLLFHSFICQAKLNVKDNPNYLRAIEILRLVKTDDYIPRSLAQINKKEYGIKGFWIFIGSIMSVFALGQAILTYDHTKLISYVFTIILGIIFGILEMKKYEEYYTGEYLDYALMIQEQNINDEKESTNDNNKQCSVQELSRTSSEE